MIRVAGGLIHAAYCTPATGSLAGNAIELVVYAHSIDFGAKGYGNLVELASLQRPLPMRSVCPRVGC
jgi:hypothetical protein